jgi:hypothetical protein
MYRLAFCLALATTFAYGQGKSRSSLMQQKFQIEEKKNFTASVSFEGQKSDITVKQKNNSQFGNVGNTQNGNQDFNVDLKGFNVNGIYDWDLDVAEGVNTSSIFGVSFLSSSSSNNDDKNNQNNQFNVNNTNSNQYKTKKTTIYFEQAVNYNVVMDGFTIQPFAALNLGFGQLKMDSQNQQNQTVGFQSTGFQNLETNFVQFGGSLGANFIVSDTFVPFLKARITKEVHSVSTFNQAQQFNNLSTNGSQDPDVNSTSTAIMGGIGIRF